MYSKAHKHEKKLHKVVVLLVLSVDLCTHLALAPLRAKEPSTPGKTITPLPVPVTKKVLILGDWEKCQNPRMCLPSENLNPHTFWSFYLKGDIISSTRCATLQTLLTPDSSHVHASASTTDETSLRILVFGGICGGQGLSMLSCHYKYQWQPSTS